jgi:hypothetical protein
MVFPVTKIRQCYQERVFPNESNHRYSGYILWSMAPHSVKLNDNVIIHILCSQHDDCETHLVNICKDLAMSKDAKIKVC